MATTTIKLEPGTYFVGVDRPWYATRGAVRSRLGALGFRNVLFYDRESKAPPVNARLDPLYSDDWDEWVRGEYTGAATSQTVDRVWAWLVRVPRAVAQTNPAIATAEPESPSKKSGGGAGLALVPAAAAVWIWLRVRRR